MTESQEAASREVLDKAKRRKQPQKRARQRRSSRSVIYIGPNLRGLAQYTVFRDEVPPPVRQMIDKQPEIRRLIVSISQIGAAAERMERTGTLENKAYHQLRKDVK
ncbi:hypothetical protein DUZ99_04630 [Xylanibacillus composti]|uniref:Uncharacterized protein n=1 Tax=Xylanibacillus composti TaxID=1572762 RepID=A0A8J4H1P6_9BACL|nr:hypothetical protein [Xylanibacillus composti]MDT9724274.1 hypothetical protein [Xylanibacillus composti]GIQ69269.1 hypothetical protein XYCOK13_20930 [Xylanibacillus composti]